MAYADDLKAAFPFPRFNEIDNMSLDELKAMGHNLPPYHGR